MDQRLEREIARLRANLNNVRFDELRNVWEMAGGTVREPRRGSHYVFKVSSASLTVPFHRPHLRRHYVKAALDLLEEALT